jgi:hypothetical protein
LIRLSGSFTWATSTNSATSWPAHSHTPDEAGVAVSELVDFMRFNEIVETLSTGT